MRRLLWKEWREEWGWLLLLAAAIVATSLFGQTQRFYGQAPSVLSPWLLAPLLAALLLGLQAYAADTPRERAHFTFSRPIAWPWLLLAKLLPAAVVIVGAPLLAAAVAYLIGPAIYRPFLTLPHALAGAWAVSLPLALVYLFGLGCSTLLAGLAGSLLTLTSVMVVVIAATVLPPLAQGSATHLLLFQYLLLLLGAWVGTVAAGLSLTGAALTRETGERMKRFVPIVLLALLGAWGLSTPLPLGLLITRLLPWEATLSRVSPGGVNACVTATQSFPPRAWTLPNRPSFTVHTRTDVVRLSDGAVLLPLGAEFGQGHTWRWATNNVGYFTDRQQLLVVAHLREHQIIPPPLAESYWQGVLSPDRRRVAWYTIEYKWHKVGGEQNRPELHVADLFTGKVTRQTILPNAMGGAPAMNAYLWWATNDTVGIMDHPVMMSKSNDYVLRLERPWLIKVR